MSDLHCGMCRWFSKTEYMNWGYCDYPLPEWALNKCERASSQVWCFPNAPGNYAPECDVYEGVSDE